jgi:hypothetical protein
LSPKLYIIGDKLIEDFMTYPISNKIVNRIYGKGRGSVFTPKDFQDLVSRDNVKTTLKRLSEAGTIRRLLRGVYEYPEFSRFLNAPASPNLDLIARAIAMLFGEIPAFDDILAGLAALETAVNTSPYPVA